MFELQAQRFGVGGTAVTHHAHLASGLLIFCPRSHHERVVDRQAKNVVDTLGFELVVMLDVAWHVLRRARRREGAG